MDTRYRLAVLGTLGLVAVAFGLETAAGNQLNSRYLIKDGIDWLYAVAIYSVAAVAYGRSRTLEYRAGLVLAFILCVAAVDSIKDLLGELTYQAKEQPAEAAVSMLFALAVGAASVALLWRFRTSDDPVIEATWLSARNDLLGTIAGGLALLLPAAGSSFPDLLSEGISAGLTLWAAVTVARDAMRLRDEVRTTAGDPPPG